jgi:hypothetical protein
MIPVDNKTMFLLKKILSNWNMLHKAMHDAVTNVFQHLEIKSVTKVNCMYFKNKEMSK